MQKIYNGHRFDEEFLKTIVDWCVDVKTGCWNITKQKGEIEVVPKERVCGNRKCLNPKHLKRTRAHCKRDSPA